MSEAFWFNIVSITSHKGSHYYFRRYHDSKIYMTHVQHHGSRSIPEGTMGAIIKQSGIPKSEWINS